MNDILTEIKYHRKQISIIRSEKETLESVLGMKVDDVKKSVKNEEKRVNEEMERNRSN